MMGGEREWFLALQKMYLTNIMSIEHLGMYDNGKEDFESVEVKKWAGAKENYTLNDLGGKTELVIDMDMGNDENMIAYFE
jgi:hypothetical protein